MCKKKCSIVRKSMNCDINKELQEKKSLPHNIRLDKSMLAATEK